MNYSFFGTPYSFLPFFEQRCRRYRRSFSLLEIVIAIALIAAAGTAMTANVLEYIKKRSFNQECSTIHELCTKALYAAKMTNNEVDLCLQNVSDVEHTKDALSRPLCVFLRLWGSNAAFLKDRIEKVHYFRAIEKVKTNLTHNESTITLRFYPHGLDIDSDINELYLLRAFYPDSLYTISCKPFRTSSKVKKSSFTIPPAIEKESL